MSEASPYAGRTPVASLAHAEGGPVTLIEGSTFALSGRSGDMRSDLPHGLFMLDTRILSRWGLRVNGHRLEPLSVDTGLPFAAAFASRCAPAAGRADAELVVFRRRHIGRGMRENIVVRNHGLQTAEIAIELHCEVDFAGLFEVKESRVRRHGTHRSSTDPERLTFHVCGDGHPDKHVEVAFSKPADMEEGRAVWRVALEPGGSWELCILVALTLGGRRIQPRFHCDGQDEQAVPAVRLAEWKAAIPRVETDHEALAQVVRRSAEDLGALRIFDPDHPQLPILAAGAPWFMTVFGRDSLITAWMTLLADPTIARGVLETLARFQGTGSDPHTEEQPGRILHEIRFGGSGGLALGGGDVYYGTVDATPLFVMLLGELHRWNPDDDLAFRLLPHADRALEWIERFGDRDGDGYVEYLRSDESGLANQGWKDSWDAVRHADGRLAEPPIALCEVQGYVYSAYVARARFAREAGDGATFERCAARARELRRRFNEDFWMEDQGTCALALDGAKRQVRAVASNAGHCLWTGIVEPRHAARLADRLMAEDMFSGFGVRTLAASMPAFNPISYHNGSVWPHDNAICAAGLARYGFTGHAHRIIEGQLAVASRREGALPELFGGFARSELPTPAEYPTSCHPQAWAAAAPLLWLRSMLQLNPRAAQGEIRIDPALPPSIGRLCVDGIRLGERTLTVTAEAGDVRVEGAGGLRIVRRKGPPTLGDDF